MLISARPWLHWLIKLRDSLALVPDRRPDRRAAPPRRASRARRSLRARLPLTLGERAGEARTQACSAPSITRYRPRPFCETDSSVALLPSLAARVSAACAASDGGGARSCSARRASSRSSRSSRLRSLRTSRGKGLRAESALQVTAQSIEHGTHSSLHLPSRIPTSCHSALSHTLPCLCALALSSSCRRCASACSALKRPRA